MTLDIRPATDAEIEPLAALLAEMDDEAPAPPAHAHAARRAMSRQGGTSYLAWQNGRAVGTFTLLVFTTPVHGGAQQAVLDGVVVTRERRGQGIGRAMMQQALRLARDAGCYKLTLSSNIRRDDAHRFYRSLGFAQHGWSFRLDLAAHAVPAPGAMTTPVLG
jgi:GNAT superfamily N-acetyltransferase